MSFSELSKLVRHLRAAATSYPLVWGDLIPLVKKSLDLEWERRFAVEVEQDHPGKELLESIST